MQAPINASFNILTLACSSLNTAQLQQSCGEQSLYLRALWGGESGGFKGLVLPLLEQAVKQKGSRRGERGASPSPVSAASSEKDLVWMAALSVLAQEGILSLLDTGSP